MSPRHFLLLAGCLLLFLGLLGVLGVLGPTPEQSLFGAAWWLDRAEQWASIITAVVSLLAYIFLPLVAARPLVWAMGILFLALAAWAFFRGALAGATLELPGDLAFFAILGVWALLAGVFGTRTHGV